MEARPEWQERFAEGLRQEDPRLALVYDCWLEDEEQSVERLRTRLRQRGYTWTWSRRHLSDILNGNARRGLTGLRQRAHDAYAKAIRRPNRRQD